MVFARHSWLRGRNGAGGLALDGGGFVNDRRLATHNLDTEVLVRDESKLHTKYFID